MFERSFVDTSGDGSGVLYYDVGVAGDGLRGERRDGTGFNAPLLRYNPARQWTADQDEPENWQSVDGVLQLVSGGKHYGHLEVNFERIKGVSGISAQVILSPIHVFPILDSEYNLIRSERRLYRDEVVLWIDEAGRVVTPPMPMPEVDLGVGATLPVPTEGQVMELTISAKPDAGWLVYTDADWISGEPDRGFGDGVVRLTINGNQGSARSASVRIGDATLVLEQMGFFRGMIIR
jgi:hypothetical protein